MVVVFDNELKAYDGSKAISDLESEGSISIHARAVITKNADGKIEIKQKGEEYPVRTVGGTAIGALIGLLGGPIGVGVGAIGGTVAGGIWDINRAGVSAEFLDQVSAKLTPGKWAVVSDISEDWETPVDTRMAALGGTVFRTTRKDVGHEQHAREVAAIKANIAQLKAEQAKSSKEEKAKMQLKIDDLKKKLDAKSEHSKQRSKQKEEEYKAKVDALEKKAAKAKGKEKTKIENWIADIKEDYKKDEENFDRWATKNEDDVEMAMTGAEDTT